MRLKHFTHRTKSVLWGLAIILLAIVYVLYNTDVIDLPVTTIIFGAIFLLFAIKKLAELNFTMGLLSLGIALAITRDLLMIPAKLTNWVMIVAMLFIGIGLDMILKDVKSNRRIDGMYFDDEPDERKHHVEVNFDSDSDPDAVDTEFVEDGVKADKGRSKFFFQNAFGENTRYVTTDNLKKAKLENGFGKLTVYFDQAVIAKDYASITIDNGFGNVNLYLPANWRIDLNQDNGFGSVKVIGSPSQNPEDPLVEIKADNGFGHINIYCG